MKRLSMLFVITAIICSMSIPVFATEPDPPHQLAAYESCLPNYNMNLINGYCCGPTAAAEMLAYWDLHHLKDNLWQPNSTWNSGFNVINHLAVDMGTTANEGTTPAAFRSGLERHVKGLCGNPAPRTARPLPNYTNAAVTLYQKTDGTSLADMWNVIKNEIDNDRPVALFIGRYPLNYNTDTLYGPYSYHWQVIYKYIEEKDDNGNITERTVNTRTGFGFDYGLFDLNSYWNYTNGNNEAISDFAIVTLSGL